MFVLIMVSLSIALTIVQLNIHFRSPTTHEMPDWMRVVSLKHVPRLLRMKRPGQEEEDDPLDAYMKELETEAVSKGSSAGSCVTCW